MSNGNASSFSSENNKMQSATLSPIPKIFFSSYFATKKSVFLNKSKSIFLLIIDIDALFNAFYLYPSQHF